MKQFLITVAGVFTGLALFVIGVPLLILALASAAMRPAPISPRSVLVLDLRGGLADQDSQSPLALIQGKTLSVIGVEETLRRAAGDDKVRGLLVRLPETGMPPAAADELRIAFLKFRRAGKPIVAHAQGLYAAGMIASTYELAAASGEVWMQPASAFQVTGLDRQDVFLGRFFQRHDLIADFQQRYEYKNAVNPLLYSDYTPAHRMAELSWLGSVWESAVAAAAADRGKPPAALAAMLVAGPWSAEQARTKGLIDRIGQVRDAERAILKTAGRGAALVDFSDYAGRGGRSYTGEDGSGPTVAVIAAEGTILTGKGPPDNPLSGGPVIRSDDVARAFYEAINDDAVKAVVFRLNSPGGSDTASEQIAAAVRAAVAAGKPVVVSMGTYGASGGYWVSAGASKIVAQPTTLTGSIGVFGGKFVLGPALARFGVDMRGLSVGSDYAAANSPAAPMTAAQRATFSAWMDHIYDGFIDRVAEGRRLPEARVRQIARGRVWTGVQAKSLGLVDQTGGFYDAVDLAKRLASISGPARLRSFNVRASPLEALQRLMGADSDSARLLSTLARGLLGAQAGDAALDDLSDARLRADGAHVLAPRLVG